MKHSANLQFLRGAACTLVFVMHFMLIERKVKGHAGVLGDWAWIGSIAVDLFFAISGFIMVRISSGRFEVRGAWGRFIVERAARIYPAYWAFSLLVLPLYIVKPSMVNSAQGNHVDLLASFLLLPQPLLPLLAVGWTLVYEMYFYIVFTALLAWLPERLLGYALGAWALEVVAADHLFAGQGPAWLGVVSNPMALEFIAGAFAGWLAPRLSRRIAWACLGVAVAWLAAALFMQPASGLKLVFENSWSRVWLSAVPCALIVFAAVGVERPGAGLLRSAAAWVGDRSYSFYLCHLLVLSAVARLWAVFPESGVPGTLLVAALAYVGCLMVSSVSYRWLERPVMRRIKQWLMRRVPRAEEPYPSSNARPRP